MYISSSAEYSALRNTLAYAGTVGYFSRQDFEKTFLPWRPGPSIRGKNTDIGGSSKK